MLDWHVYNVRAAWEGSLSVTGLGARASAWARTFEAQHTK